MSEPRKNHLSIDGGQIKEDENVSSYKPIPESETDYRSAAKPVLSKSKERISDEAEEKLLDKEQEAKIVTRVDMADAKYVVGDHRNGDAKIELDANKRQFSGLTKEELLKYADDPFWVRLRWFMFALFWALWLCMLAGAVAIIVRAPKCAAPTPKTWFEKGPLVDPSPLDSYEQLEYELPALRDAGAEGIFTNPPTYDVLDDPDVLTSFKEFVAKAKEYGIKVIVDLTPNYVSTEHPWFTQSVNRTPPYDGFFTWAKGRDYSDGSVPKPPNNWVSTADTSAWEWNKERKEFFLHQYGSEQPDLNFHNPAVVEQFDKVLDTWVKAGADGVRLHNVRQLLVNTSLPDEAPAVGQGSSPAADHLSYLYWRHRHTSDQPALGALLRRWAAVVGAGEGDKLFTVAEDGRPELWLLDRNMTSLRPRAAVELHVGRDVAALVADLEQRLGDWPAIQLSVPSDADAGDAAELALFALLLPAAPVLQLDQLLQDGNDTAPNEKFSHLVSLREDASIEHGELALAALPGQPLVACARWKAGHTGYLGVYNAGAAHAHANVTLRSVPADLTLHHLSRRARERGNYTHSAKVSRAAILVPAMSTVVLSYVPRAEEH